MIGHWRIRLEMGSISLESCRMSSTVLRRQMALLKNGMGVKVIGANTRVAAIDLQTTFLRLTKQVGIRYIGLAGGTL